MKYDDAEIYFLNFETDLPNENGGRHMGLFLEWAIRRGLANDELMAHAQALRDGATTGLELLFDQCDGKLTDEDFNDEGNAFAESYYERWFLREFSEIVGCTPQSSVDEVFGADFTPKRHRATLWLLDRRYSDWLRQFGVMDRQALLDRALTTIQPVAEAMGFPRVDASMGGSHIACATFERGPSLGGMQGYQRFDLIAMDWPEWFYGLQVRLSVFHEPLRAAIYAEKTQDLGVVTQIQNAAEIPFQRLAEGWQGPVQDYDTNELGFWIFWEREITPLVDWLAGRLRGFALPALRGLDSVDALALAYGTRPMSASAIHVPNDPYAALLAAEQARHPRLGAMLDETRQAILAVEPRERSLHQRGALLLIERIRARSGWWMH